MRLEPFKPEHMDRLKGDLPQKHIGPILQDPAYLEHLARCGGWTAFDGDRAIACGGVVEMWPGHYSAWAFVSATIGNRGLLYFTRVSERFLSTYHGRVEAVVEVDFLHGHRWADLLGFTRETPGVMRKWFPDGGDAALYARVT